MTFLLPGYHPNVSADRYHADPCWRPSLSSSLAKVIVEETPLKAFLAHPRLNKHFEPEDESKFDMGSAVHDMLASGGKRVRIIPNFTDYKKEGARTERDKLRAQGFTPLLEHQAADVNKIADQVVDALERRKIDLGAQEAVFIAEDHGVLVRAMMDGFAPPRIWDFKITSINLASDAAVGRHLADMNYDLRAAFYLRVAELVFPQWAGRLTYSWILVEKDAPHGLRIVDCDGTFKEMGARKYRHALGVWKQCIESGRWPHLEHMGRTVPYPSWNETAWLERETTEGFVMGPQAMLKRMDEGRA